MQNDYIQAWSGRNRETNEVIPCDCPNFLDGSHFQTTNTGRTKTEPDSLAKLKQKLEFSEFQIGVCCGEDTGGSYIEEIQKSAAVGH